MYLMVSARRTQEASDKVWLWKENTQKKALAMLAAFCQRFEAPKKDLCDIDKMFGVGQVEILVENAEVQRKAEQAMVQNILTRNAYRTWATSANEAEADLNHGLRTPPVGGVHSYGHCDPFMRPGRSCGK